MRTRSIIHLVALILLTLGGCCWGYMMVLFFAMFMVTDEFIWLNFLPIAIVGINVSSIRLYRDVLIGGWKYVYNICVTILVTAICFYAEIEWTSSIHCAKGSAGLYLQTVVLVVLSILGISKSVTISRQKLLPK